MTNEERQRLRDQLAKALDVLHPLCDIDPDGIGGLIEEHVIGLSQIRTDKALDWKVGEG